MERAFVDTSAWFAYANRQDPDHQRIRTVFQTFQGRLITSNFVFDETVTLCLYRLGHQVAATVGDVLRDPTVVAMIRITPDDEQHAWVLWLARPDKTYTGWPPQRSCASPARGGHFPDACKGAWVLRRRSGRHRA
jgi:predicted nucleic acid-binding protein